MVLSFITLTNLGYLDYTRNLIKSLERCECSHKLKVYCCGQECYDNLDYDNKVLMEADMPKEQQIFYQGEWNKITLQKFRCIMEEFELGNDILFTDGDIVWLNNKFIRDIQNRVDDNDLLFQNDKQHDDDPSEICTGIIYAKCNDNNKKLFNLTDEDIEKLGSDQEYINNEKDNIKYERLPLRLYPNGKYWREQNPQKKYCIHFNYLQGDQKKEVMKNSGNWYL
jgi:hypothetical protein